MKEIGVFIASASEVKEERMILNKFFEQEAQRYLGFNLKIKAYLWELESFVFNEKMDPKQNDYNELIRKSDIVIFIFATRVGKYTKEEFLKALEYKAKFDKPKHIITFFKKVKIISTDDHIIKNLGEISDLKSYIGEDLKQVHADYSDTSDLLLKVHSEFSILLSPYIKTTDINSKIITFSKFYNRINQRYYIEKKEQYLDNVIANLQLLDEFNIPLPTLSKSDFYDRCAALISHTKKGESIKALSMMLKSEWNDSAEELEFWKINIDAITRGVYLERIFIIRKNEAHRLKSIQQIQNHIANQSGFLKALIVERETLEQKDPELLIEIGEGFLLFGNKWALLDYDLDAGGRGSVINNEVAVMKLYESFENLKKYTEPLKSYIDNIPLSHAKKEMLSIFLTTKCNLNCDYCFTNKNDVPHKNQTIDFDFAKCGIDDYFKTDYLRHIRFFGAGEPTVEFDLLKKIHSYALEKGGKSTSFEMQTNGAFGGAIAKWLANNIDIIWISCDGTPDIHDSHRPFLHGRKKSSKVIEKNIHLLQNYGVGMVGIRSTITEENVEFQNELIDYFSDLGIKHIWVDPIFPSVSQKDIKNDFDTMHFSKQFLAACSYAEKKDVFYGSILTCNFADSVNIHCRASIPLPHLTTDGYVSACDMALFGEDNDHMQPFIYGKWDKIRNKINLDKKKISLLQSRNTANMTHCKKCESKEHCGGYCLGEVLNETKSLFDSKKDICESIRFLDENMTKSQRRYKFFHP